MMQQLARAKFMSNALRVPTNWQNPSGDPGAQHYGKAFKDTEKSVPPGAPPLFTPASPNKYHVDTQKMLIGKFGDFIDKTSSAVCSAWNQWQTGAMFAGFIVTGPVAAVGVLSSPVPIGPLILAQGANTTPNLMKYTNVVGNVLQQQFTAWALTVKSPGLPFYPAYAAVPTPVAPPMPNVPFPLIAFTSGTTLMGASTLKPLMVGQLADPTAPFHQELFDALATAIEACFMTWLGSTMVNNVMAIASGGTPISPIPAVGTAMMPPGGLT